MVCYLQCEDRSSMMKWIEAIQSNNNPDEDVSFTLGFDEIINITFIKKSIGNSYYFRSLVLQAKVSLFEE